MSPRRTRRGTVRDTSTVDVSINTSIKSAKKPIRNTRQTRRNPKASDEDSDSPVKVNNLTQDISTSFASNGTLNTKRRKRKVQDSVLSQNISLPVTVDESTTKKSNLKTPKAKKSAKSTKSRRARNNSLISDDESFNTKSQKDTKRVSYSMDNLISEDEDSVQVSPSKKVKLSKVSNRKSKTPDKPSTKATTVKSTDDNVTPKSSPINVSFTPHRSKKTPKRSPINLGSPKSLPRNSLKNLNVQRRLSIAASPPSSENSANSVKPQESTHVVNESLENTSISSKKRKSITYKILNVKTPKGKSKKLATKSRKVVPKQSEKSPTKSVESPVKSVKSPGKSVKSPVKSIKSPVKSVNSPVKSVKSPSVKSIKSPVIKSPAKLSKSPAKLPKEPQKSPMITVESTKKLTANLSLKIEKIPKVSLEKVNLTKSKSPNKSAENPVIVSPHKLQKSSEKSTKSLKATPGESRKSFLNTSLKSRKSFLSTSFKSKKSPFLNLSSKKMPKIVLNLKSNKSPFKLNKTSSSKKAKKSLSKSPKTTTPAKTKKSSKSISPRNKLSTHSIVSKSISQDKSLSPKVLLDKLLPNSTPGIKSLTLNTSEKQSSIKLIPVYHKNQSPIKSGKSPKSSTLAKRSSVKPLSPSKSLKKSISAVKKLNEIKTPSLLLERKFLNMKPASTSTPRDKNFKRTLSTSIKKMASPKQSNNPVVFNGSPNSKSKIIKHLNNSLNQIDNSLLENVPEPSFNDSSLIRMSDVFDSDNSKSIFSIDKSDQGSSRKKKSMNNSNTSQKGNKNNTFEIKKNSSDGLTKEKLKNDGTYELEHPKTPALQKKVEKKIIDKSESVLTEDQEAKKTCKVTFTTPNSRSRTVSSGITRMGTPGHAIQQRNLAVSVNKIKTPINKIEAKNRLSSVMKSQSKTAVSTPMNKRRSQIDSVNRLSRPKRIIDSEIKVVKTPVSRRIPNFAEIHQKNFAKMESLVDLKKRVEKRHEVLNVAPSSTKKKNSEQGRTPLPSDSTKGDYNRYGFKLRKNDAIKMVSKKQTDGIVSVEKKRENSRNALKGVRMNRRFELQMKARLKNNT